MSGRKKKLVWNDISAKAFDTSFALEESGGFESNFYFIVSFPENGAEKKRRNVLYHQTHKTERHSPKVASISNRLH